MPWTHYVEKRLFVRKRKDVFGFRKFGFRNLFFGFRFSEIRNSDVFVKEDICRGPFHLSTTASFPGACIVPHGQIVRQFMQTWWSFSKAISFLFWKMQSRQNKYLLGIHFQMRNGARSKYNKSVPNYGWVWVSRNCWKS